MYLYHVVVQQPIGTLLRGYYVCEYWQVQHQLQGAHECIMWMGFNLALAGMLKICFELPVIYENLKSFRLCLDGLQRISIRMYWGGLR